MSFYNILSKLTEMGQALYTNFLALWDMLTTPIQEAFPDLAIIDATNLIWPEFGTSSIVELMIGGGVTIFLTMTLAKWLISFIIHM